MDLPGDNYSYLIQKIDEFIRKYYLNKVIRGCIYLATSLFISYILVTVAEFYGNFNPLVRTILFYAFLVLNLSILTKHLFLPLLAYFKLGKILSHEQASVIIGQYFSPIKDKLINTLQLKQLADNSPSQKALIEASINQKITELKPIPFRNAIKIKENKKYLKYALAPLFIILLIAFTAPAILSESTERLIKYNQKFTKKAPFRFIVLNKNLSAVQGEDFELKIKLTGNEIPEEVYLEDGVNTFKLEKENIVNFKYTFKNLQENKTIRFLGGEFSSDDYTITVKRKPTLINFDVLLKYPDYLGKKGVTINNTGDLIVPEGTIITWKLKTKDASSFQMQFGNNKTVLNPSDENSFSFSHKALHNTSYSLMPQNKEISNNDQMTYQIQVTPDAHPTIEVNEQADSLNTKVLYFTGRVSDDYGFSRLTFHYKILTNNKTKRASSKTINFDKKQLQSSFLHYWDINELNVQPGEQLEYYFEVWDNDGVHGPKGARSSVRTFNLPSVKEIEKSIEASSTAVKQKMEQAIKQAGQLEREAKKLTQEFLNKKTLSYEDKKQVESLLQKQKNLEELINQAKQENKKALLERQDIKDQQEAILEKQKQIEDLFNNVLDEKTRELLRNIEKLLEENNKKSTQQELSKMQMDNKTLQKELDRILELYKQLDFDQKLTETIDALNQLSKEQKKLSEQSLQKNANPQQLKQQQNELQSEFKDIQKDLQELEQKNELLEDKRNFQNPENEQDQIEQQQEQGSKNLTKKEYQKAAQNQKNAAQKMQELADKLQSMQNEEESGEVQVNMQRLKEILDNLINSSFKQENVMQALRKTSAKDPNYTVLSRQQKDVKDNLKMIQDSLYALSKKVPQIQSVVNKEIASINFNIDKAIENLSERKTIEANSNQQYAMTAMNNLALLLSEALEQLQKAMKNGNGGKGKQKSLSQLSKMQEQLNKNMEKARQQIQKQGPTQKNGQLSQDLAKMVREQQLIRQTLQEINREMNKDGRGKLGNLDKLSKEMEQTETDLVNKKIQESTIIRQQQILSKLLEAEKSERERDMDTQRESRQGRDMAPNYKAILEQYQKNKVKELEILQTIPPSLNSFYKNKVEDYLKFINSGK